jgi:hypothetical protein
MYQLRFFSVDIFGGLPLHPHLFYFFQLHMLLISHLVVAAYVVVPHYFEAGIDLEGGRL